MGNLCFGAGSESGEDVAALAHVEVSPGVADEEGARGPATALQHLLRAEIGLRVLLVRVADEARIRLEGVDDPFPDVPDHLPAAEGAIARGKGPHVHGSRGAVVEV